MSTPDNPVVFDASFFDPIIDRRGTDSTHSTKWAKYAGRDVVPMWVADMDFASPPAVLEALHRRVDHGVFGYSRPPVGLVETMVAHLERRHRFEVDPEALVWLPGLVPGINLACRAVGEDGDGVATFVPVYHPFLKAPALSRRTLVTVPLAEAHNRWQPDAAALAKALTPRTRLFLLCNPHNPVGRVFGEAELTALAEVCLANDVVVVADEIHCDLILEPGLDHLSFAALAPEVADRTITLLAPSKTYNLAGLGCSLAVITNRELRERFKAAMTGIVPDVTPLSLAAAEAAYGRGEPWRQGLIAYLRHNRDRLQAAVAGWPGVDMAPAEATYLAWLDCRATGVDDPLAFCEAAGVGPSPGAQFGAPGFVRLNFGCPTSTLETAIARLGKAFGGLAL
ncbi:MAG: MalY/PatB family protein [Candidatus Competibacterales bacterium]